MDEPRCIICGKEKDGVEIKDDNVIKFIRLFNRKVLKKQNHYKLVVCKECYINYKKARNKFVRRQITYIALGVIFAAMIFISSAGNPISLLAGAGIIIFLYLLSLLSYMPELKINDKEKIRVNKENTQQNKHLRKQQGRKK